MQSLSKLIDFMSSKIYILDKHKETNTQLQEQPILWCTIKNTATLCFLPRNLQESQCYLHGIKTLHDETLNQLKTCFKVLRTFNILVCKMVHIFIKKNICKILQKNILRKPKTHFFHSAQQKNILREPISLSVSLVKNEESSSNYSSVKKINDALHKSSDLISMITCICTHKDYLRMIDTTSWLSTSGLSFYLNGKHAIQNIIWASSCLFFCPCKDSR